jgi:Cu2+-exporting ATPase
LRGLDGVIGVHIDDVTQRARVRWDPDRIRLSDILRAVADIGYIAHPYDASRSEQLAKQRRRRSTERLIFAGIMGMLVMHFSLATWFMGGPGPDGRLELWEVVGRWTTLMITALILAYPGQEFLAGAWDDLKNRRPGMDVPVVLGLSGAWLGSLYATVTGRGEVYFESIAMFVFFLLLARRYELRGKLQAADRLERLARISPRTAHRLDTMEQGTDVPVGELIPGDRIRLLPGETLAVDGIVLRGSSSFDESLLTGESVPVLRQPGDAVVAGSVNGDQPVVITVTHGVQTSAITEIRQLVERGLEQRPRVALLAERAASWFVAALLLIATLTAVIWWQVDPAVWLTSTIAVLIVTCPCALAMATPVALAVSAGRFIDLGVLPLRMRALDALADSKLFVFDKTGTLTEGQPALVSLVTTGSLDRDVCLRHAAALSADSEHPLARSLRKLIPLPRIGVEQLENIPGAGIRAHIDAREWRLGTPEFAGQAAAGEGDVGHIVEQARQQGRTVSVLSGPRGVEAVLAFEDPLRAHVETMLRGLRQTGVDRLAILSGDADIAVRRLGERLGIAESLGGMSPQEKLAWTRDRQHHGHRVAMFGDGINDAPTLAAADVSLSFTGATDLANTSSDFLILGSDISVLVKARRLAGCTRRNIRQNLAWAASYNLLAVPFAAMGWIPPWGAAIGMSLSSLLVVMNALRLQRL